ncbi:MAG: helix-turn-helix domain-containing protein [Rhizobiaceae bacterium]|nr:helix-turn-helix domain-containing protein [Rhizobiaceae bacterium]
MTNPRKPSEYDREHGRQIARRRKELRLSQAEVAAALGVSTQQYGKYERGENRLSAGRDEMLERFFSGKAAGLSEAPQARYQAPITKSALQKSLDQIRASVELLQRHLDRL